MSPKRQPRVEDMDLRDLFAMLAMTGMVACETPAHSFSKRDLAEDAYALADAMLRERDRKRDMKGA